MVVSLWRRRLSVWTSPSLHDRTRRNCSGWRFRSQGLHLQGYGWWLLFAFTPTFHIKSIPLWVIELSLFDLCTHKPVCLMCVLRHKILLVRLRLALSPRYGWNIAVVAFIQSGGEKLEWGSEVTKISQCQRLLKSRNAQMTFHVYWTKVTERSGCVNTYKYIVHGYMKYSLLLIACGKMNSRNNT